MSTNKTLERSRYAPKSPMTAVSMGAFLGNAFHATTAAAPLLDEYRREQAEKRMKAIGLTTKPKESTHGDEA